MRVRGGLLTGALEVCQKTNNGGTILRQELERNVRDEVGEAEQAGSKCNIYTLHLLYLGAVLGKLLPQNSN